MKKSAVCLLVAQLACASAAYALDNPAREAALNMMRHHDYNGAQNKLNEAVGFNATDPENYMLRGKCFFLMRNYQLAIEDFNHTIEYSPNYYRAYLWRGTSHARLGNDDLAVMDYQQAIKLHPQLAKAFYAGQAGALPGHKAHAAGPAIQDYKQAMASIYPTGYNPMKATTTEGGTADDGADEFSADSNASGERSPQMMISVLNNLRQRGGTGLVQALAQSSVTNDNTEIKSSDVTLNPNKNRRVTTNLDTDPNFGHFGAADGSQPLQGDPNEIIKETTEALRMDNTNPELFYKRAKAYQKLEQANKAFDDYSEAIRLFPKAKYYVGRASLFYQLNKPMLVDADVKSAVATDPTTPRKIEFGGEKYPSNVRWGGDGPDGN